MQPAAPRDAEIEAFWADAKVHARLNPAPGYFGVTAREALCPAAWALGATVEQADELLALVLSGVKTATASALWDYQASGEPLPESGQLAILLDGSGTPRALLLTTDVSVMPFDKVDAAHAAREGEGDGSLAYWREVHRSFFTEHAEHAYDFSAQMPVVCERFEVLYTGSTGDAGDQGLGR